MRTIFIKNRVKTRLVFFIVIFLYLAWQKQYYPFIRVAETHKEMSPLIEPNQLAILYIRSDNVYRVGDVIYAKAKDSKEFCFMRIVARDSGHIAMENGKLVIDGNPDPNIYIPSAHKKKFPPLEEGQLFCVFDNQNTDFEDSLILGAFGPDLEIKGKLFFKF